MRAVVKMTPPRAANERPGRTLPHPAEPTITTTDQVTAMGALSLAPSVEDDSMSPPISRTERRMDQVSQEDIGLLPAVTLGPITRMGERIAALEGRVTAEIGALKEDTKSIRASIHDVNNHLQGSVMAERQCAIELAKLTEKMQSHSESVAGKMLAHTEQLTLIAGKVETLTAVKHQVEGGWWTFLKLSAVLMAVASSVGAAFAAMWWIFQHVQVAS